MRDMADGFKDLAEISRKKKENNRCKSAGLLDKHEVVYASNNGGAHLVIKHTRETIDFWPGTGKWKVRKGISSRGVFKLLRHMGVSDEYR